jgi:hypothetical protein
MNTVIDRDWQQQEKFGKDLTQFENDMRSCSRSLRSHVEEARGSIRADNANAALEYILQLLDQIDASLPGVAEFGAYQIKLSHSIQEAEAVKFTKG